MNKLSIIISIYNCEKYLEKCINSILFQTFKDFELILVDDGSTDNSRKICDLFADKDKRIKVLHKKNQGVSIARNEGINIASGEYITFVDADDWIELEAYENLIDEIEKSNADLIIYNFNKCINEKNIKNLFLENDVVLKNKEDIHLLQAKLLATNMKNIEIFNKKVIGLGFPWNKIYKREIIKKYNLKFEIKNKGTIFEDVLFNYKYLEYVKVVKITNKSLYNYRIISNSASRKYTDNIFEINNILFKELLKYENLHTHDKYYYNSLYIRIINNFFFATKVYLCNKDNKDLYFKRFKKLKNYLKSDIYNKAFNKVDSKYCNLKIKLFKILIKFRLYFLIYNCIYMMNYVKK